MSWRVAVAVAHDIAVAALAWLLSYWLRFNLDIPSGFEAAMWRNLGWILPLQAAIFHGFGLYRGIWRFASIPDLRRIALAAGSAALAVPGLLFMLNRLQDVPRSVLVMDPLLLVLLMGGSRFLYRAWKDGHLLSPRQLNARPVLILGPGAEAAALLRDLARSNEWRAVGLLDDDPAKAGALIHGIRVLGPIAEVVDRAQKLGVDDVIVAMPHASASARRHAVERAAAGKLNVLTVPALADLLSGRVSISAVRRVELEDLLGRDPVQLDEAGLHGLLSGKVVLVTGAGGSIGGELCRQIAHYNPARLVLFEQSEFALYSIQQEFAGSHPEIVLSCVLGDVKDRDRVDQVFTQHRPEVVFHAAACKHVPLMETENAWQALRNNVLGTARVARAAIASDAGRFVLVSTDKAVNPTNVMGASKRLAERVCQVLQSETPGTTRFVIVRFGNVLGSSGSVIPKFREQIAHGGPVTVTHPEIIRYFMLIPEAAQLVLQAGLMGQHGEIFVLDMGEPVKILDLARDMIRLSGFGEDEIKIEFTGLRPGEKLFEELLADSESTQPTPNAKLRIAKPDAIPDMQWLAELESWLEGPGIGEGEVKTRLKRLVPEYQSGKSGPL